MEIKKYLDALNVTEGELKSKSRKGKYVMSRQLIWFHLIGKMSAIELGKMFNRDHSTVVYSNMKIAGCVKIKDKFVLEKLALLKDVDDKCL